jgi:MOSC domain-containing protein YiiM
VRVLSVNIGLPRQVSWHGKPVTTGIWKEPVDGRVAVRWTNLDGDGQADLRVHGGSEKAVYVYPSQHYELWSRERPELAFGAGTFGENLMLEGLARRGRQRRRPLLGLKLGRDEFVSEFLERGLLGFYLAVAREGDVAAGDPIVELP